MKVIITGATGMVGKGVLLECLDHLEVEKVLLINRRGIGISHAKLEEVIHADFSDYSSIKDQLKGFDAAYLCMGVSAAGLDEAKYAEITHSYTINLAKTIYDLNPKMTITYVSGQGTDSSEKGRMMWARVKGKTENDLLNMGFSQAFMFRPGTIIPLKGIRSSTKLYQFFYDYFMWLIKLIKLVAPNTIVNTTQLGLAMINVTKAGYTKKILSPKDILVASKL
ncbi:NAD-dependent epimerase/dehydratase family protein [Fulvivirga lutimaris]|uniref:NAD-dependent epimerase/dehydratase family protein n=1 Tax=Fulvivirga lutimaris TaxID=1819566 RepID=UPI0012BC3A3C|nr:NAD-dependent epimerase/dehydratase family protein [Fulvivirga lutimaris]MTI40268.1 NAD-dependent epimerase/dehydratase family protein [Fulvivirga lutimaris]